MNVITKQKVFLLSFCSIVLFSFSFAQQKYVKYTIINRKDSVGNLQVTQKISGDDLTYSLASIVEMKILMTIRVSIREEVHFHKDKLISSSSKRLVNDKLRGNKQTKATADGYTINDNGKESRLNQKSIGYDFVRLYFKEPLSISHIYSDYYQKVIAIKTVSSHVYQIDLPEGGSNTYYYENGTCRKVDIRGTFFNGQMILNG